MKRHIFAVVVAVLFVVLPATDIIRASTSSYTIEDLGTTSDGFVPVVTGMNASGQVSGYVINGMPQAVRYSNGVGWQYLHAEPTYSLALGINANGDVTGYHLVGGVHAFRYSDGTGATSIVVPGANFGVGHAINARGVVTGYANTSSGDRGWRAAPGVDPVMLAALEGDATVSCGINDANQIVGSATTITGQSYAYRVDGDSVTPITPLSGASGTVTACAIDESGRVGGQSTDGTAKRAFVFTSGSAVAVDTFASRESSVAAIANGVSVGWFSAANGARNAFVHTDANGSLNLNDLLAPDSGWHLEQALAVNASGLIAGNGLFNGVARAFRLKPEASTPPADTTAPEITAVSATPSTVWPPNGALVSVTVAVTASDEPNPAPVCSLTSLGASAATADGSGITGLLSANVRAVGGVTYTLTVTCTDAAGNSASGSTSVVVPPDTTAPRISYVQATPDAIWPPNGKMVPVTVTVSATDDVDAAPQCYLTSVSGGSSSDAVKTGRFTADVRSEKNADGSVRVYSLNVQCTDSAGNKSHGVATVVVGKDSAGVMAFMRAQIVKLKLKQQLRLQRSRGSSR